MEKHLWLVLNFDRESHFIWGKKSSFLEKNETFWRNEIGVEDLPKQVRSNPGDQKMKS